MLDGEKLLLHLLLTRIRIDAADNALALLASAVVHQLTRRFRAPEEQDPEHDRRNRPDADHVAPAVGDLVECCVERVGKD